MVPTQKRIETKNSSRLTDWLTRPREKKPTKDQELEKALALSQKEHVAEQQRIYQQVRRLNKGKQPMYKRPSPFPTTKPLDTDDEDDVFQTVSTRPPLIKTEKKRKRKTTAPKKRQPVKKEQEEEEEEQLIIDDVSEWLSAKKEKEDEEEEEVLEIDNVSSWLQEDDPIKTAKTEKQLDEQDETLEIQDVSAWLDEDSNQTNEDTSQPPKKKQRRVRCHICNKLVERDDIRLHTRQCTMENDDETMPNGPSTHNNNNNNERSSTRHSPTSSHSNERTAARRSPSATRNNNERNRTRYPASTYLNDNGNQGSSSSGSGSSSKQECPICFKLFDMAEIEVHSASCNSEQDDMQVDPFNNSNNDSLSFDINMDNNPIPDTMSAATHEGAYEFTMERQVYDVDSGDSSSEYSFIDMSSSQFDEASVIPCSPQAEEEDDGYLSPLEGHVNILEDPQRYQQYFAQFNGSTSSSSTRGGTRARTTRGRKTSTSTRSFFARKNFYKKRGRGGRGGRGGFGPGKSV